MKTKLSVLLLNAFLIINGLTNLNAQVTIGASQEPDEDAVLELISSDTKGLLLPRLELSSTSEPSPLTRHVAGMIVYNTGSGIAQGYYYNDGTQWILIADTNSSPWRSVETGQPAESATENIYQAAQVSIGSTTVDPNAQLDVSSITKGVLLPRLTTQQRDAIPAAIANGLLIYNTSTNCFNYRDGGVQKWLSLCGTYDPAKFEFSDCTGGPAGSYKAGVPLSTLNTYTITVRVSEPGTYQVLLSTTNGYSFSKSGVFTETGVYTLTLEGQGTPAREATVENNGLDIPTAQFNGQAKLPDGCTLPGIKVDPSEVRFTFACNGGSIDGVTVFGTYMKGEAVDGSNYVELPITVTSNGITTIETDFVNGLKFSSGSVSLTASTTSVKLYAQGTPAAVSNATTNPANYTPTGASCTFLVPVITTMGTFKNPAKNCLAILTEDPSKKDGEYWVQQASGSTTAVKTMCDMTNGGFTLVWSYSESTARTSYGNNTPNDMSIYSTSSRSLHMRYNQPFNVVTTESDTIKYENYRLANGTMKNVQNNNISEYRIRIVYDPKNLNDAWGKENYFYVKPRSSSFDYLSSTNNTYTWSGTDIAVTGKIFNLDYTQNSGTTVIYGSATRTGNINAAYYGSSAYPNHWDAATRLGSTLQTTTITKSDGTTMSVTINPSAFNNLFGFFGETIVNHHFGKCSSATDDDYSFSTMSCGSGSRYPHSFNRNASGVNQGRFLQWWIK